VTLIWYQIYKKNPYSTNIPSHTRYPTSLVQNSCATNQREVIYSRVGTLTKASINCKRARHFGNEWYSTTEGGPSFVGTDFVFGAARRNDCSSANALALLWKIRVFIGRFSKTVSHIGVGRLAVRLRRRIKSLEGGKRKWGL